MPAPLRIIYACTQAGTIIGFYVPLELMHVSHRFSGLLLFSSALVHTIAHVIRWGVRGELLLLTERAGLSGVFAMLFMTAVVLPMLLPRLKHAIAFESRFRLHWLFVVVVFACLFHATRTAYIMLVVVGAWILDYAYQMICMTYKLDHVR